MTDKCPVQHVSFQVGRPSTEADRGARLQVREDEARKSANVKGTPEEKAGAAAHVGGPIKHAGN